jgi:hypothetical protein
VKKLPKPQKRKRMKVERKVHRERLSAGRVYRVYPDFRRPFVVELRLARDGRRMRGLMDFHDGKKLADEVERECMGLVRTWWGPRTRRAGVVRRRQMVARMYLNVRDLRAHPSEIVPHECVHAAMAWARFQRVNLNVMPGEEIMAHAAGRLVVQINRICFAEKVWPS